MKDTMRNQQDTFHKDCKIFWSTSNELFEDCKSYIDLNVDFPGVWRVRIDKVEEIRLDEVVPMVYVYSDDVEKSFYKTSFIKFEEGKIKERLEYWAWQDEQPSWRREYTKSTKEYRSALL